METAFSIDALDTTSLVEAFGERGLDLSHFPTRTERKRAGNGLEEELYVLRRYLFTLDAARLLSYPVKLSKSETPDFVGTTDGAALGVEITEATSSADQREMTIQERSGQPALLGTYGGRYRGGIRDDALPERGRRADRDLTADVMRAVRRKRGLSYQTPQVDLVLYANGNANMMADFATFSPLVCQQLDRWSAAVTASGRVRRVAIMKEPKLILWDRPGRPIVMNLYTTLPPQKDVVTSTT
ncbi:MAG: hypothetical protein AB7L90_23465 [Hyphomicrobiaceae bacterium]|uniref:hypothetical protein n=1 Tax=Pseudorhodoplanes sp. TaxID=1934341 RepID=UPI003D1486A4